MFYCCVDQSCSTYLTESAIDADTIVCTDRDTCCANPTVATFSKKGAYMSARTRHSIDSKKRLVLFDLMEQAARLIREGSRHPMQVAELEAALQMFKEGKLDGVVLKLPTDKLTPAAERRAALKLRIAAEGSDLVWREFLERLTTIARNRIVRDASITSLEQLLRWWSIDDNDGSSGNVLWGLMHKSVAVTTQTLRVYGLYPRMTKEEIDYIFSPSTK